MSMLSPEELARLRSAESLFPVADSRAVGLERRVHARSADGEAARVRGAHQGDRHADARSASA